ncbi:OmpA family protein [Flavobacterium algicola]|uniref:OmpA family protein n=1 Tax=Flavobacterium algicola TaxID=556529 RepID=UPI001EFCE2FA|nr:OmpA family protein [Flavobacterium algicola]MCG9792063.1 OmpA family protein [Flavobacterium algicola]
MKNILTIACMSVMLCCCKKENTAVQEAESSTTDTLITDLKTTAKESLLLETFDWSKIPESTADIGVFPYISAPEGFIVKEEGSIEVAKNGMTNFFDFNKLYIYNGNSFFSAEGKKASLYLIMKDVNAEFNQLKFDKSVDNYLKKIGAVLVFEGKIPAEKLDSLQQTEEKAAYKYIQSAGSPYDNPVRNYALNHKNGKIFFQLGSNSAHSEIGIIALEGFKQTIKAPTASEMQKEIETKGKAVLHINFDTDKATLQQDGQKNVDEIFALLTNNSKLKLSIEGHTDNSGSVEHNKQLSADRANTVMYALAGKGIDINRLKVIGFGAEKPLITNTTEENKAKNRRVELVKF